MIDKIGITWEKLKALERERGVVGSTAYWVDRSGQIQTTHLNQDQTIELSLRTGIDKTADLSEFGLPIEARIERVDVKFVNPRGDKNPKYEVIFMGQLHADEDEAPEIWEERTSKKLKISRLEVMQAHNAARMFNRRDLPVLLRESELTNLTLSEVQEIAILPKGTVGISQHGLVGLDEIVYAWHHDVQLKKLVELFKIKPNCLNALSIQAELKTIVDLTNAGKILQAEQNLIDLKPVLAALAMGGDWVISRKLNLNRQFPIESNAQSWADIESQIVHPEARMLLQLIKDNPGVKYLFTIHEDHEFGTDDEVTHQLLRGQEQNLLGESGVYFYDTHWDANNDPDKALIELLHHNLVQKLVEHGFKILNGVDDASDPTLGFVAERGYINQPIIDANGNRAKTDRTLETAFAELGRLGLKGVNDQTILAERAFCLEIPGRLESYRKTLLLDIYQTELIIPFLAHHGIK